MSRALALAAVAAWALGAAGMPVAGWFWLRDDRRRLGLVAFAAALVAQGSWLALAAAGGPRVVLDPGAEGFPGGWTAWAVGVGGLAALASGLRPRPHRGRSRTSDRVAEIGVGLFGLGVLLRQVALLV